MLHGPPLVWAFLTYLRQKIGMKVAIHRGRSTCLEYTFCKSPAGGRAADD